MTEVKTITVSAAAKALNQSCDCCLIRSRAVCAHCDGPQLAALEGLKAYRSYLAGQTIVLAGEQMDFVGSLVAGVATLTRTLEDGRTQMVGLLLPSDFLGRPGRAQANYTVTAASDLTLCCFRRRPFEALVCQTPTLSSRLLEMTLDELDAAREWLLLLGRKSARERIASFLVILARRDAALRGTAALGHIRLTLPLTREAMADYLGLTIETVSRQMTALRRDGVIALQGAREVRIPDFAALVLESGDDADGGPLN